MWRAAPAVLIAGVIGCSSTDRAPFLGNSRAPRPSADAGPGGPLDIPPPLPPAPDAGGLCGNVVIPIATDPLNLYFIVDMSGSMDRTMPLDTAVNGVLYRRYQSARQALQSVLRAVGHRVSYGATWFPDERTVTGCTPGDEFFETQPGDLQSYAVTQKEGPVLKSFLARFDTRPPLGGTPTAATIASLRQELKGLPGKTIAFLITDGAPSCSQGTCGMETCTHNIEGTCPDPSMNCCDPALGGTYGNCLDDDASVSAVAALADSGVPTIVFGMPGTDEYVDTLNRMATAGGAPRAEAPYYYSVKSTTELSDTLRDVGIAVSITCDATFETPPPAPRLVNVFFDQTLVPLDPENGWSWDGDRRIVISGTSCEKLKNGDVSRLQVVAGCPSISR